MNRKLVCLLLGLVCVAAVCSKMKREPKMDDVLLQNVEALASDETGKTFCVEYGCVDCPERHIKVRFVISGWSLE